ncbi:MAG: hypothetical protein PWQ32_1518 [Thermococcaceae archaeon]|nr:hypothetical protein [Thermococcaceae archaeon]
MDNPKDPIMLLFKKNSKTLELLGRAWDVFYFEGKSPDVGKRRENFIVQMLRKEFHLNVEQAPDTEREWDFKIILDDGSERYYSLKTTEGYSTVKVAWDGFPSEERILGFEFHYNIMYVVRDKEKHTIEISIIDVEDLKKMQDEIRKDLSKLKKYWWIPKSGTNPRGFGLYPSTIKQLIESAKRKENYIKHEYKPLPQSKLEQLRNKYFEEWYELIKKIALESE